MAGRARVGGAAVLLCTLMVGGITIGSTGLSAAGNSSSAPILGLLGSTVPNFTAEQAAGVNAVTISVGWDDAEPNQGIFSSSYIQQIQGKIAAASAAGLGVVLDPGLQYPPAWAFSLPGGTQFVNQYGQVFSGSQPSGNNVVNAVTDMAVQSAEGVYLAWLGQQITPGEIIAVRQGGGPLGELRYPGASYGSSTNCFWAYDSSTQASLPSSVRGWVPGSGTAAQATTFLNAYNQSLDNYGIWLNGQLQQDFATRELVLLPGWGQRPGGAAGEEAALLAPVRPLSNPAKYNEYNEGLDWTDLLDALPDPSHAIAYTTYLDAQTVQPGGLPLEDPADFLASLVAGTPIQLGGENSGNGTLATMTFCMAQALRLNFFIADWQGQSQLMATAAGSDPTGPTLAQLGDAFSTVPAPVAAPAPAFPPTVVGQSSTETLTITAESQLTVDSLTASGPFSLGTPGTTLPAYLPANGSMTVPVTFNPTTPGASGGGVAITTAGGRQDQVTLTGTGENSGPSLATTSGSLDFGGSPPGSQSNGTVGLVNDGSTPLTITSMVLPGAPFGVSGAPSAGQVIQPGAEVVVNATFAPTATGQFSSSLGVESDGGDAEVTLTGIGTPPSLLVATPLSISYGNVRLGQSSSQTFQLNNVGGSTLTVTSSQPPALGPFTAVTSLTVGTTIPAGSSLVETVTFTPSDIGAVDDQWTISANDGQGMQVVDLAGVGVIGDPSLSGWMLNGTALLTSSGAVHLTTSSAVNQAGSAFWPTPVSSSHLAVTFTSYIGSGTGADGTTFVLANATDAPSALGTSGVGLGFAGISGVAVALDTHQSLGNPSANFVGVTDGPVPGQSPPELHWLATDTNVAPLRVTHSVTIVLDNGLLTVAVDGTPVMSQAVSVGPKVLVGFTASSGAQTDIHSVSNVSVSAG
jgi:hypothetical protein